MLENDNEYIASLKKDNERLKAALQEIRRLEMITHVTTRRNGELSDQDRLAQIIQKIPYDTLWKILDLNDHKGTLCVATKNVNLNDDEKIMLCNLWETEGHELRENVCFSNWSYV